jgi:hypothetical protein
VVPKDFDSFKLVGAVTEREDEKEEQEERQEASSEQE